ncbi:hypothetical protein [Nocardia sp. NPDC049707]|uniref:hypothetical protein n=1 Tax=Nocardia sp. NPDC049707 TaxID=3154735 RepID=UPI003448AF0E
MTSVFVARVAEIAEQRHIHAAADASKIQRAQLLTQLAEHGWPSGRSECSDTFEAAHHRS